MTIDKLVGKSATELEALTEEQLNEYFAPYLKITRPDQAEKPEASSSKRSVNPSNRKDIRNKDIVSGILGSLGLDLDDLRR